MKKGYNLLENKNDIIKIGRWNDLNIHYREIYSISYYDFREHNLNGSIRGFLKRNEIVFVKSREKKFSSLIKTSHILNNDEVFNLFLIKNNMKDDDESTTVIPTDQPPID